MKKKKIDRKLIALLVERMKKMMTKMMMLKFKLKKGNILCYQVVQENISSMYHFITKKII